MGEELVESSPSSAIEVFRQIAPFYMSIGMTWDEFWNGDCEMARYFLEAEKLRSERKNYDAWLQGLYVYEAICDVAPILVAYPKKGAKVTPYSKTPYGTKEENNACSDLEYMKEWATQFNARFEGPDVS